MISVIIPMYNSQYTIIDSLESIKNQTAFDMILEIIIVNDGSTDNSLEVVKEYAKNNKDMPIYLIDKPNGGVSTARNTGMKIAKGKYIALLDSDDIWISNKIEIQMKVMIDNPNIDFLGAAVNDRPLKIIFKKIDFLYKANIKDICIKCFPQTSTVIFKKDIIQQVGFYNENQKYAEDGNYYLKICSKFNYYYLPIKVVNFGGGKREFGIRGLSSNLKGMHEGNLKNIKEIKDSKLISNSFYWSMYIFYWIKYFRRIIITSTNNMVRKGNL